jgi:hypothetical protein
MTLTAQFVLGVYKYVVAGSKGFLLVIWTSWHPCELSILSPTHLSCLIANPKWDWEIQVHLLVWLHLVTLGDHCGYGFLISLGGCHHLDCLE